MTSYPKRLIEVDLPIKRISAHARREKSIRHGHISTLHIWWARRPLAACRAVICAALWPDPADSLCPPEFREEAARIMNNFATKAATDKELANRCSPENWSKWKVLAKPENQLDSTNPNHLNILRYRLLDFIADFANWDNSTQPDYLETSRALTQIAHEALGGIPGTKPLVVDPFAGGGAIPLEALRVGADAFASDLNPVAVLLNKVVLEYIPKYGQKLADEVRKWGQWVKEEAEKELAEFYPKDPDGSTPIAYLWARTIVCEGPGCGTEIPLLGNFWLSKSGKNATALTIKPGLPGKQLEFEMLYAPKPHQVPKSLTPGNSATCPHCNFTTSVKQVRKQLSEKFGGSSNSRLIAVVVQKPSSKSKSFRLPNEKDLKVIENTKMRIAELEKEMLNSFRLIPNEPSPPNGALGFRTQSYGMSKWRHFYNERQLLTLCTFSKIVGSAQTKIIIKEHLLNEDLSNLILAMLSINISKLNDKLCSLCRWQSTGYVESANGGQNKMPMLLDYAEANPFGGSSGDWSESLKWVLRVIDHLEDSQISLGMSKQSPAQKPIFPDDSIDFICTDPPYYDAFGYSDLSEFFYIWLKRSFPNKILSLDLDSPPKKEEAISIGKELADGRGMKDDYSYTQTMTNAFNLSRTQIKPTGVSTIVFANKTTVGWEAILQSLVDAGWIATASWPIDTERPTRQRAIGAAALASSVHIVCRPRENPDGSLREEIGDWRDVLQELPQRIHEWMPRLASEGVVGADAIFACLGPALEVFSRYSSVEKASGEQVTLKEYLEYVWAAVSKEALSMIFSDADATGFEADARLSAMWLWTLSTGTQETNADTSANEDAVAEDEEEDEEGSKKSAKISGFVLEFDAARKIAQGLGAHLENLTSLVQVKGDKARLLPVSERSGYLFGKDTTQAPAKAKKKDHKQLTIPGLFVETPEAEDTETIWGDTNVENLGKTVLDRVHQSMILFAAGRSEALKRFLVDEGVGSDQRFWTLAQAFSALYPTSSEEKRWVDGVLARKKGLGF